MAKESNEETSRKTGYAYAAGITLFAAVATFCGIGWLLDKWFNTRPWFLIGGIVLGSAAGLFEFIRISKKTY